MRQRKYSANRSWRPRAPGSSSGRFPDARYVSVQVYTPDGVGASLTDYRIAPQPGSLNPWQRQGPARRPVHGDPALGFRTGPAQHAGAACRHHKPAHGLSRLPGLPAGWGCFGCAGSGADGGPGRRVTVLPACPSRNAAVTFPAVSGSDRVQHRRPSWSSSSPRRAHSTTGGSPTSTPPTSWPTWPARQRPTSLSSPRKRRRSRPAAIRRPGRPGGRASATGRCASGCSSALFRSSPTSCRGEGPTTGAGPARRPG